MKGIVNTYLNERVREPNVNADNPVYYEPGDVVEIVDILNGQEYEGNKVWYQLDNGAYIWSGGIEGKKSINLKRESQTLSSKESELVDYNAIFTEVPDHLKRNKGSGIMVAVLDSGIFERHPGFNDCFASQLINSKDYTNSKIDHNDAKGHGTHVGGLIGARSNDKNGIIGVAPECDLWNLKCIKDDAGVNAITLEPALDEIILNPPDIVNMSFNLTKNDFIQIEPKLKEIHEKGSILVSAAGENNNLKKYSLLPALSEIVISVGCISKEFELNENEQFHQSVDFVMPFIEMKSLSIEKYGFYNYERGSSMAAGLVSGLIALIIKEFGKLSLNEIKSILKRYSVQYINSISLTNIQLISI